MIDRSIAPTLTHKLLRGGHADAVVGGDQAIQPGHLDWHDLAQVSLLHSIERGLVAAEGKCVLGEGDESVSLVTSVVNS